MFKCFQDRKGWKPYLVYLDSTVPWDHSNWGRNVPPPIPEGPSWISAVLFKFFIKLLKVYYINSVTAELQLFLPLYCLELDIYAQVFISFFILICFIYFLYIFILICRRFESHSEKTNSIPPKTRTVSWYYIISGPTFSCAPSPFLFLVDKHTYIIALGLWAIPKKVHWVH